MPVPKKGETEKDFISRCIPYVIKEGTAKDTKQAAAICYSIWRDRNKHKHMYTLDLYDDGALIWNEKNDIHIYRAKDSNSYPAVCLIGDKFYKGMFLSMDEIRRAYKTMDGAFHDINHWGTSYPAGLYSMPNIEYIVGYQKDTTIDEANKLMKTYIHIEDTAPKADVWRGFMNICEKAGKIPNVSVTFWAGRKDISAKDLPDGVDYKSMGYKDDDTITSLVDLEFHALATVFKGACSDNDGCGIGLNYDDIDSIYKTQSITKKNNAIVVSHKVYDDIDVAKNNTSIDDERTILKKEILKEKIKKEELINGREVY